MHNGISLKYKFFITMSLVTILVSCATAYYGQKFFAEDKIAYIFDHEMSKLSNIEADFIRDVERVKNLSSLVFLEFNLRGLSKIGKKIFHSDKSIIGFEVYRGTELDFSVNKEEIPSLEATKSGIYLVDNKKLIFSLYFPVKGSNSFVRVLFKPSFASVILEKSSAIVELHSLSKMKGSVLLKKINDDFLSHLITQGTFEEKELVTFVSVAGSFLVVSRVDKEVALAALYNYYVKIFFVVMLFVGLSMSLAIWIAGILTKPLHYLFTATQELGLESTYNKIEVTSDDEIGHLTEMFNTMSDRIVKLLNELRVHNLQLEETVALRTHELSDAVELQKSVMNSLEEGIIVLDSKAVVTNLFSSSAKRMFPNIRKDAKFSSLLNLNPMEEKTNLRVIQTMYKEMIPFKDIKDLAVQEFQTSAGSSLEFNYSPVRNSAGKIEKIVILSMDKTEIRKAEAEAVAEKKQAKMFVQIMSNKSVFSSAMSDINTMLIETEENQEKSLNEFFHVIHSIKGIVVQFYIETAAEYCNKIEDQIEQHLSSNASPVQVEVLIEESISVLREVLSKFFEKHGNVIGVKSLSDVKEIKLVELAELIQFKDETLSMASPEIKEIFNQKFCTIPVGDYISAFEETLYEAARKSNKLLAPISIFSNGISLPLKKFDNFFYGIQHLLRNCIEHGIEESESRTFSGKPEEGRIDFLVEETGQNYIFKISDDGQGISGHEDSTKEQLLAKITNDGFSSSETVNDFSGRGVGMGAVKEIIESYKGNLELLLSSEKGTTFQITVPKS